MPQINWLDRYSLGVGHMDEDHRQMAELINRVTSALGSPAAEQQKVAASTTAFNELLQFSQEHFAEEEREMQEFGYPGYEGHKALHAKLFDALVACKVGYEKDPSMAHGIPKFLEEWLFNHLLGADSDYARFVARQHKPS